MVQITVEILDILAIATNEMKQSRTSEFYLRFRVHDADIVSEKFLKRVVGRTDLEDGMKKLDKLTNEEVVMAMAQLLKVAHNIDKRVTRVDEGVSRVDDKMLVFRGDVQVATDEIKTHGDKIANSKQRLFSESSASSLTFIM